MIEIVLLDVLSHAIQIYADKITSFDVGFPILIEVWANHISC